MRKKRKKRRIVLFVIELLLVALLALGVYIFYRFGTISREKLGELLFNTGLTDGSGYRNIVLYGVDSREGNLTHDCHSDTIMVCSINNRTKEVRLVSVYRDTYLDNTNGEFRKATECYYFGGPERSINMLNKNLDLQITDYLTVNFQSMIQIVDTLGGVDLEITGEEMELINGYCVENSQVTGVGYTPLDSAGWVHLDGIQALAYCRIRYTEGWDFKRTERQRLILSLCLEKARSQGILSITGVLEALLPNISTSMSTTELMGFAASAGSYTITETAGFPFDQYPMDLADAGDCVVPVNLAWNVTQLHEFLYGESGYAPTETVQAISSQITANTGI